MDAFPTPLFSLPAEAKKTGGEGPLASGSYGVPTAGTVGRDAEVMGRKAARAVGQLITPSTKVQ